jgi:hypothetical protein
LPSGGPMLTVLPARATRTTPATCASASPEDAVLALQTRTPTCADEMRGQQRICAGQASRQSRARRCARSACAVLHPQRLPRPGAARVLAWQRQLLPRGQAAAACRPTVITLPRRGRSGIIIDCEHEEAEEGGRQAKEGRDGGEGPDQASNRHTAAPAQGDRVRCGRGRSRPSRDSRQDHRGSTTSCSSWEFPA